MKEIVVFIIGLCTLIVGIEPSLFGINSDIVVHSNAITSNIQNATLNYGTSRLKIYGSLLMFASFLLFLFKIEHSR